MEQELKPGMRVRITDPNSPCETGTLVSFTGPDWLVRLDVDGWEWGGGCARRYPNIGDKGFWWALPEHLKPLTEHPKAMNEPKSDFSEAIEHLEALLKILKAK